MKANELLRECKELLQTAIDADELLHAEIYRMKAAIVRIDAHLAQPEAVDCSGSSDRLSEILGQAASRRPNQSDERRKGNPEDAGTSEPAHCNEQPEAAEPTFWWNGIRRYDERDGADGPSFRDKEDSSHDIPLYSGINPCNLAAPVAAQPTERRKGERRIRGETVINGLTRRGDRRKSVAAQPDALEIWFVTVIDRKYTRARKNPWRRYAVVASTGAEAERIARENHEMGFERACHVSAQRHGNSLLHDSGLRDWEETPMGVAALRGRQQ